MLPRYLEDLYTLTYQEDSLDRDEDEDPEIPAWGASRYKCSIRTSVGEITGKISYRAPLRSPQPLASLQVGRQAPRHGLVRYFPTLPFLAALAALYLTLVTHWVGGCHFRISTQRVTFKT